jgi:hypothetical protein
MTTIKRQISQILWVFFDYLPQKDKRHRQSDAFCPTRREYDHETHHSGQMRPLRARQGKYPHGDWQWLP